MKKKEKKKKRKKGGSDNDNYELGLYGEMNRAAFLSTAVSNPSHKNSATVHCNISLYGPLHHHLSVFLLCGHDE
jgi:hypothetical protein